MIVLELVWLELSPPRPERYCDFNDMENIFEFRDRIQLIEFITEEFLLGVRFKILTNEGTNSCWFETGRHAWEHFHNRYLEWRRREQQEEMQRQVRGDQVGRGMIGGWLGVPRLKDTSYNWIKEGF